MYSAPPCGSAVANRFSLNWTVPTGAHTDAPLACLIGADGPNAKYAANFIAIRRFEANGYFVLSGDQLGRDVVSDIKKFSFLLGAARRFSAITNFLALNQDVKCALYFRSRALPFPL
jgi:hypothetical protein